MAKSIVRRNTDNTFGAQITAAQASSMIEGVFVGVHTDGKLKLADFRASQGPIVARGAILQNAQMLDPKGNVLDTWTRLAYHGDGAEVEGFVNLTVGATYYLSTGGGISVTLPAATTGDIDLKVGYALSSTRLRVELGQEVIHA